MERVNAVCIGAVLVIVGPILIHEGVWWIRGFVTADPTVVLLVIGLGLILIGLFPSLLYLLLDMLIRRRPRSAIVITTGWAEAGSQPTLAKRM